MYAEPSARRSTPASIRTGLSSSAFRPSNLRPSALINFIPFSMCSISSMCSRSSGGPGPSRLPLRPFDQLAHGFRKAGRLGAFLDQSDRPRGDCGVAVIPVQPNPAVLPDVDLAVGEVLDQGDHAPLLSDYPANLGAVISTPPAPFPAAFPFFPGPWAAPV